MKILIDIDDCTTNMSYPLISRLNNKYGTSYTVKDITSWDWIANHFPNPWEVTNDKSFWDDVFVFKSARAVIEEFVKQGHQVYLVTASFFNDTLGYKIQSTLDQFDPMLINEKNIIICQDKQAIDGDIRIDDGLHNFSENTINLLYSQPWNERFSCQHEFIRVKNWNEIRRIIIEKNRQAEK